MRMSSNLITMIVILVIWMGVFLYLIRLDRKVERLKKR
jgi:CcmD family protein